MINQFCGDRDVIAPALVAPGMDAGTKGAAVSARENEGVPRAAWLAADRAFESPEWHSDRDELASALIAAAPHIRMDELNAIIQQLADRMAEIPLLGRKSAGKREALDEVLRFLLARRRELEAHSS